MSQATEKYTLFQFQVFKSRFLRGLESQLIYYFYVLVRDPSGHYPFSLQTSFFCYFTECISFSSCHFVPGGDPDFVLPRRDKGDAEVQR